MKASPPIKERASTLGEEYEAQSLKSATIDSNDNYTLVIDWVNNCFHGRFLCQA